MDLDLSSSKDNHVESSKWFLIKGVLVSADEILWPQPQFTFLFLGMALVWFSGLELGLGLHNFNKVKTKPKFYCYKTSPSTNLTPCLVSFTTQTIASGDETAYLTKSKYLYIHY